MDAELVGVEADDRWRLTGPNLRAVLEEHGPETFFAVVATCGTTNFGIIDDLASVAEVCREYGIWFHVDGAYGGAGLAAPSVRELYAGVEHCDSFIVDPHKWLFAPFDCCALLYREPALARAAHTQRAGYLDVLTETPDWNPTDYSVGLTRRARGLPFWFSLAVNGTDAYTAAIEHTLDVARFAEAEVGPAPHLELVRERDLSVVVFRRLGWSPADYQAWSDRLLADEFAFVVPTTHAGRPSPASPSSTRRRARTTSPPSSTPWPDPPPRRTFPPMPEPSVRHPKFRVSEALSRLRRESRDVAVGVVGCL